MFLPHMETRHYARQVQYVALYGFIDPRGNLIRQSDECLISGTEWLTGVGTFETCRRPLKMSVYRGRPEVTGARRTPISDTERDSV
jgi:hypothetical protein